MQKREITFFTKILLSISIQLLLAIIFTFLPKYTLLFSKETNPYTIKINYIDTNINGVCPEFCVNDNFP